MITIIIPRKGNIHIVSYRLSNGNYQSFCGKNFQKTSPIITLSADNTISTGCKICKSYYDQMYHSDLDEHPTLARNGVQIKYFDALDMHRWELWGPKAKYEDLIDRRWMKLVRFQRLMQKVRKK